MKRVMLKVEEDRLIMDREKRVANRSRKKSTSRREKKKKEDEQLKSARKQKVKNKKLNLNAPLG